MKKNLKTAKEVIFSLASGMDRIFLSRAISYKKNSTKREGHQKKFPLADGFLALHARVQLYDILCATDLEIDVDPCARSSEAPVSLSAEQELTAGTGCSLPLKSCCRRSGLRASG